METLHDPTDMAKCAVIADDMSRNGWQGSPLVADGNQLITGAHRWWAWRRLLGRCEYDIPVIDIREVFRLEGLDYDDLLEAEGTGDWYSDLVWVISHHLPATSRKRYGIDVE